MTATPGPLFSMFSRPPDRFGRPRGEAFLLSIGLQAVVVALLTYFTCCIIGSTPALPPRHLPFSDLPLIFSGSGGGGGGGLDPLPAGHGNPPRASLENQLAPPSVIVVKEMPRLPMEPTIVMDSGIHLPEGGQIGDPMSNFSQILSNGPGGPGGIGTGCCDGIGPSKGPHFGPGPASIYAPGKMGVTVPVAIYSPEPEFSDEARKVKHQGTVLLLLVVGKDGHPYNIHVGQSLGMGLDEKAIEAVSHWRFRPATYKGQAVATQIAVEVDFHLY
ncbi:MAG TPA: energy transducer TonB [Candidatus Sulfotelmatobacter sp.]|nr:energy transducer TonB [Candidatus Sulfotelmatobacter sp.]